tara:strand:+ start:436 stop:567 length:132 start_codon:yes stop_codon:yes gene_type:complete
MAVKSLVVSIGLEQNLKTAELKNASSGLAHKKRPLSGGHSLER